MSPIRVEGVWKFYGDFPALRDISFDVDAGRCLALIGRNGAGKTTLLRIMAGLSHAGRGRVQVFGEYARNHAARGRIGILGHGIAVYDELAALENLKLFARLYALPSPEKTALEWLERTGLDLSLIHISEPTRPY